MIEEVNFNDCLKGKVPLSGTDSQSLIIADYLMKNEEKYVLCSQNIKCEHSQKIIRVNDLIDAVSYAESLHAKKILITNKHNRETYEGLLQAEDKKIDVVIWDHNGPYKQFVDLIDKLACVKKIICVSNSQANSYRHKRIFKKMEVIYNSINLKHYQILPTTIKEKHSVCFLGSPTESKGLHVLIRNWHKVRLKFPEAKLYLLGSAKLYDRSIELGKLNLSTPNFEEKYVYPFLGDTIDQLKNAGVYIEGLLSPNELKKIISKCYVGIVNPNLSGSFETFCVSAIEIQALQTAVIGAKKLGLRETIEPKKSGILIKNERELSTAIIKLLSAPELSIKMGLAGRKYVEQKFSSEIIYNKWSELLNREGLSIEKHARFNWVHSNIKEKTKEVIRLVGKMNIK